MHLWAVARELGHQSTGMSQARYGPLARVTERSEVVDFLAMETAAAPWQSPRVRDLSEYRRQHCGAGPERAHQEADHKERDPKTKPR